MTAPLVLLAYDRIYLSGGWRRAFRDRWALYAALAAPTTWLAWYLGRNYLTPGVMKMTGVSHPWISPWMYLRSQAAVVLHYLRVALWPDALCLDYCWPVASETEAVVPGLVVLALVATSLALLWRRPQVGFLLGTFFVILAPTSSFVPLADLAFDHRMYLPLAPLVALVVLACRQANQSVGRVLRWEPSAETRLLVVEAILVAIPLGWRTVLRNEDYRTEVALYRADVAACPQSRRAQNNLGVALLHSGFVDEGLDRVQRGYELACAVVRDGREIDWYFRSLQLNLESVGRSNELKERLASARERNPNSPHIRSMLGFELMTRGEYPDAIRELQAALKVAPTSGVARRELVRAEIVTGRPGDAVRELKRGVALQPNDVIGLDQLSWVLATHPDPHVRCGAEAVRISEKVCLERGSQMTQSWSALAAAYAEVGRFPDAVEAVLHAIDLATRRKQRQGVDVFVEQLKRCQSARPERMNFQAMSKVEWPALAPWENRTN